MSGVIICTSHEIDLCDQMKKKEVGKYVACLGNRTGACWVLVGRPEEKKTL